MTFWRYHSLKPGLVSVYVEMRYWVYPFTIGWFINVDQSDPKSRCLANPLNRPHHQTWVGLNPPKLSTLDINPWDLLGFIGVTHYIAMFMAEFPSPAEFGSPLRWAPAAAQTSPPTTDGETGGGRCERNRLITLDSSMMLLWWFWMVFNGFDGYMLWLYIHIYAIVW